MVVERALKGLVTSKTVVKKLPLPPSPFIEPQYTNTFSSHDGHSVSSHISPILALSHPRHAFIHIHITFDYTSTRPFVEFAFRCYLSTVVHQSRIDLFFYDFDDFDNELHLRNLSFDRSK